MPPRSEYLIYISSDDIRIFLVYYISLFSTLCANSYGFMLVVLESSEKSDAKIKDWNIIWPPLSQRVILLLYLFWSFILSITCCVDLHLSDVGTEYVLTDSYAKQNRFTSNACTARDNLLFLAMKIYRCRIVCNDYCLMSAVYAIPDNWSQKQQSLNEFIWIVFENIQLWRTPVMC